MTALTDGFLFLVTAFLVCMLVYKLWKFFDFVEFKFWELVIREGTYLLTAGILFTFSFVMFLLNPVDNVYLAVHSVNKIMFGLLFMVQIIAIILSYKQLFKPLMASSGEPRK